MAADDDDHLYEATTTEALRLVESKPDPGEKIYVGDRVGVTWRRWSGGDATGLSAL